MKSVIEILQKHALLLDPDGEFAKDIAQAITIIRGAYPSEERTAQEVIAEEHAALRAFHYGPRPASLVFKPVPPKKLSIGRIVHYHGNSGEVIAGIVTFVNAYEYAMLTVFPPMEQPRRVDASMGGADGTVPSPGCWTWPVIS